MTHPPYLYPPYKSTVLRAPARELVMPRLGPDSVELTAPVFGRQELGRRDHDLTVQHPGEPLGERIIVTGRLLDAAGRPVRNALVEVWQANAAGRYAHLGDLHPAPLDPNFTGAGRCLTDDDGRYRFVTRADLDDLLDALGGDPGPGAAGAIVDRVLDAYRRSRA